MFAYENFQTDVLEKSFEKLIQGSGGSYFITAQQVREKLRIKQAKLQISLHCDLHISAELVKGAVSSKKNFIYAPILMRFFFHPK